MKTIYKLALLAIVPCLGASCESFLDVNPDGQEKMETLLKTRDGIESAMYGAYSELRENSLYGCNLTYRLIDVMAQQFDCYGNEEITALAAYNYQHSDVKSDFETAWTTMYNTISNVNAVLNCNLVRGAEEYPYKIYRGEALGLRAFMHFDLLRIYTEQITLNSAASGIPYATEFSLNTPKFKKASEVYALIIADLKEAERLLADEDKYAGQDEWMTDRKIHFNLYAVKATLARVYLTMGDKENARIYAQDVIDHSGHTLTDKVDVANDVAGVLSNNETIWGVYYAGFYSVVNSYLQQLNSFSSLNPRRDYEAIFQKNLDGNDFRLDAYFAPSTTATSTIRFIKLTDIYEARGMAGSRPSDLILGINMIRLPEMYYIMAETLLDKDPVTATKYFNEMLEHRGLTAIDQRPQPLTLNQTLINDERYKEFWGEGQSWFNLKRQNLPISMPDGTEVPASKDVYVVPIPNIEYDYRN